MVESLRPAESRSANHSDPPAEFYNLTNLPITPEAMHLLVYEHLVHHCYSETAQSFGAACNIDPSTALDRPHRGVKSPMHAGDRGSDSDMMDTSADYNNNNGGGQRFGAAGGLGGAASPPTPAQTMENRKIISELVLAGEVGEAIEYCNSVFPETLTGDTPESADIMFQLQCQRFVECVKVSAAEAMTFAQQELGKFGAFGRPKYVEKLNDIIGLIAYPDPYSSPLAPYLSEKRREEVATSLNSHILASQGFPSTTTMEQLIRQSTVVRETLHDVTETPKDAKKNTKPQQPRWDLSLLVGDTRLA
ncbi:CTLH/CRA C-terminal to lish motif domain-containing protein [Powellomyces hirtus]|nr:CTLH/CRA C-terminal to lish motif domain-containing protein [Powellomyces hirtus]